MKKILIGTLLLLMTNLCADDAKMELGVGVGSLYYPDYVGSKTNNLLTVPLPFIRYHSEYLSIDEDGLNSKLFGVDGLRLDLSLNGSLPASSKSSVREDMPDLDLTGEIGPKLLYSIFAQGVSELEFELPFRAVLSTDFTSISYVGLVSNPQLKYSLNYKRFEWTFRTGFMFCDKEYANYFYGVKQKYVTKDRSYYDAKNSYGGFRNRVGMTYRKNAWWFGAFVSYTEISNATFHNSPLIESDAALYTGASVAYIFYTQK